MVLRPLCLCMARGWSVRCHVHCTLSAPPPPPLLNPFCRIPGTMKSLRDQGKLPAGHALPKGVPLPCGQECSLPGPHAAPGTAQVLGCGVCAARQRR